MGTAPCPVVCRHGFNQLRWLAGVEANSQQRLAPNLEEVVLIVYQSNNSQSVLVPPVQGLVLPTEAAYSMPSPHRQMGGNTNLHKAQTASRRRGQNVPTISKNERWF